MLVAGDIGIIRSALTNVLGTSPDVVEQIIDLLQSNSEDLGRQVVTGPGQSWFGGSHTGHRIAVNTTMAHQAVEEEFEKLADSLRQFSVAIAKWDEEVREVDAQTGAEMAQRSQTIAQVNSTLEQAGDRAGDRTIGDGRYTEPTTTEGGA